MILSISKEHFLIFINVLLGVAIPYLLTFVLKTEKVQKAKTNSSGEKINFQYYASVALSVLFFCGLFSCLAFFSETEDRFVFRVIFGFYLLLMLLTLFYFLKKGDLNAATLKTKETDEYRQDSSEN